MKMKIYSIAGLYSKAGYGVEQRYEVENLFAKRPYSQTPCCMLCTVKVVG
jgi:hypothetical protein